MTDNEYGDWAQGTAKAAEPEKCNGKRFCLCVLCKARRAEDNKAWFESLAKLPEATASLSYYDGEDHEQK